ncbi:MAG TPA: tRNA-uridine aminocarboxypropyltransferase [Polyangia bacterium]
MSRHRKPHLRCVVCRMHRSLCICALLPRLETRTRVVLLLHQLEVQKTTNTGVVAARCLPNSAIVYRGRSPDEALEAADAASDAAITARSPAGASAAEQVERLAAAIPSGTRAAFLFPHVSATPLEEWRVHGAPVTLIVPDGTWSQASRAFSRLGRALALPCVTLADRGGSAVAVGDARAGGRLRASTGSGRLATLEALAHALGLLEGPEVEAALMRAFRIMTDRTLWTNGRLAREAVTGGVPADVQSHAPLGVESAPGAGASRAAPRGRRTRAAR